MGPERDVSTGSRVPTAQIPVSRSTAAGTARGGPWKAAFFVLTAVAILGAAVWALLGSSLFVARSVRITGAPAAQRAEVLRAAGITGTPLIRINPAAGPGSCRTPLPYPT